MYQLITYDNKKFALTTNSNINTSLICFNSNHFIYITQLIKGQDFVRYILDVQRIKAIDNSLVILLDIFNSLLLDINCLFRATKPFDNHVNLLVAPQFKHLANMLTFVYPSFESILFSLEGKYKISKDTRFKHVYISLFLAAYINNSSLNFSHLLSVKYEIINRGY